METKCAKVFSNSITKWQQKYQTPYKLDNLENEKLKEGWFKKTKVNDYIYK